MKTLISLALSLWLAIGTVSAQSDTVTITAVHDGDSYRVLTPSGDRYWVRLLYVDAPEVISNHVSADQPYGRLAADSTRKLLKGQQVVMQTVGLDPYSRPLVMLWTLDGTRIDQTLLEKGWAWYSPGTALSPRTRIRNGKGIERATRKAKRGLWAFPDPVKPATWRANHNPNA